MAIAVHRFLSRYIRYTRDRRRTYLFDKWPRVFPLIYIYITIPGRQLCQCMKVTSQRYYFDDPGRSRRIAIRIIPWPNICRADRILRLVSIRNIIALVQAFVLSREAVTYHVFPPPAFISLYRDLLRAGADLLSQRAFPVSISVSRYCFPTEISSILSTLSRSRSFTPDILTASRGPPLPLISPFLSDTPETFRRFKRIALSRLIYRRFTNLRFQILTLI